VECDEDSAPESFLDTDNWLNWNDTLDNPNHSEDDCKADIECDIEQDSAVKNPEFTEQWEVSAIPNISTLSWPSHKSKGQGEKVLVTISVTKMSRKSGVTKKYNRLF
jgi:hypothetical protein